MWKEAADAVLGPVARLPEGIPPAIQDALEHSGWEKAPPKVTEEATADVFFPWHFPRWTQYKKSLVKRDTVPPSKS